MCTKIDVSSIAKKAAYYTIGCKLNYAEISVIKNCFSQAGIATVQGKEIPDIVIISACSVTKKAEKKCCNLVRFIRKKYPDTFLVVTGCYAQLHNENVIEIDKIDLLVGLGEKIDLLNYVLEKKKGIIVSPWIKKHEFIPAHSYKNRTRAFLKIQDGCDYSCSYCIIPLARGRSRNGQISEIVKNAKELGRMGIKEVVLTGVNIGDFGKSTGESFLELLQKLDKVNNVGRFRISSIEPNLLSDEIVEFIASSGHFTPHFHISLQSGSNNILQLMCRKYDVISFQSKIEKIKTFMKDAFIGLDIIVGMRGENKKYFRETYCFLENLPFTQLHVFTYSDREEAIASSIKQEVSLEDKKKRRQKLLILSEKKCKNFYCSQIGTKHTVLFEKSFMKNKMYGFTENYIKVEAEYNEKIVNQLFDITLGSWNKGGTALTLSI